MRVSTQIAGVPPTFTGGKMGSALLATRPRNLYFDGVMHATHVHSRHGVTASIIGPAAIEQADTTVIVPPGALVTLMDNRCLRMELEGSSA